jgi:hypothetical protein
MIIQKGEGRRLKLQKSLTCLSRRCLYFFKYLPYWEDLTVRHAIDGMHLQKNVFESTVGFLGLTGKHNGNLTMERISGSPCFGANGSNTRMASQTTTMG